VPPDTVVKSCSLSRKFTYAVGEGANSLVMNGIFGFAMIYYTKALGLDPFWAGIAMSVSMFWEAISEPLMGHISDHTRSRWGRRYRSTASTTLANPPTPPVAAASACL